MNHSAFSLVFSTAFLLTTPVFGWTGADYYPLAVGNRWSYASKASGEGAPSSKPHTVLVESTDVMSGYDCFLMRTLVPGGESGSCRWYSVDRGGTVVDLALGAGNGLVLAEWNPPHVVLPHNAGRVGTVWFVRYNLNRDVGPDSSFSVTESYRIVRNDATVSVPAGTFSGCIEVEIDLPAIDNRSATQTTVWYAPGVGLVRRAVVSETWSATNELTEYKVYGR